MGLSRLQQQILEVLERHPAGIDIQGIRSALGITTGQEHLGRRVRALYKRYEIETKQEGKRHIYILKGPRAAPAEDTPISEKLHAQVLQHGRCEMCGKTVREDHVKLQADHRIPVAWGGKTERDNLQALCQQCNRGKKHFFASLDPAIMRHVVQYDSVHMRIGELLKLFPGEPVSSDMISIVASATEYQEDWQKRLRELRYLGWVIVPKRRTVDSRTKTWYVLQTFTPWPENPTKRIREHERGRQSP